MSVESSGEGIITCLPMANYPLGEINRQISLDSMICRPSKRFHSNAIHFSIYPPPGHAGATDLGWALQSLPNCPRTRAYVEGLKGVGLGRVQIIVHVYQMSSGSTAA